jgi:prophage regulatory protein
MTTQSPLLNKLEVTAIVRMSDRSIERLVKTGNFPPPLRLGKAAYWEEPRVIAWLDTKLEAQRAWKPKQRRRISSAAAVPQGNQQALA